MKFIVCFGFLLLFTLPGISQKPVIDEQAIDSWPLAHPGVLSAKGKYLIYEVHSSNLQDSGSMEIINCHTRKKELICIRGYAMPTLVDGDKVIIFKKTSDSLGLYELSSGETKFIPNVQGFKVSGSSQKEYVAYQLNKSEGHIVLRNIGKGLEKVFPNIVDYTFSDDGQWLGLVCGKTTDATAEREIKLYNMVTYEAITIWKGIQPTCLTFDHSGKRLAFFSKPEAGSSRVTTWLHEFGNELTIQLTDTLPPGLSASISADYLRFSNDNKRLFMYLREKQRMEQEKPETVKIWRYNDASIMAEKADGIDRSRLLAALNIESNKIIQLERQNERYYNHLSDNLFDDHIIVVNTIGDPLLREKKWNKEIWPSLLLVSTKTGTTQTVTAREKLVQHGELSPKGEYVVYYSPLDNDYFSFEAATGITRNITKDVTTTWTTFEENDVPDSMYKPEGLAGWLSNEKKVLLYDRHDIWMADLTGQQKAINLTNGYGAKNHIVFKLLQEGKRTIPSVKQLVVSAFDKENKNSGYFLLESGKSPKELNMQPFANDFLRYPLIKARNSNVYILRRMRAASFPNYYVTTDFITFSQLSTLQPEKQYNWYTTELVKWRSAEGWPMEGILYKPENFDSSRKYPVIIYYYERLSKKLNYYLRPDLSEGPINIPYFVSQGYLVFTPDIYYQVGTPLQSAANTIISAAKNLGRFSWIDTTKMGVQGHSWGGYQTNYVITQTNIFAAAASAAGGSDAVSDYGNVSHGGASRQFFYELGQMRLGATLWEKPELYFKSSAVLMANKVTTPLLMMHNPEDGMVPFSQSLEFFTALRRLQKKAWLLQYPGEGHLVGKTEHAKDYTEKLLQFFDYFLKGKSIPKWME